MMHEPTQLPLYGARYRLDEPAPTGMFHGEALLLGLELFNSGATPWLNSGKHPVLLVHRWLNAAGQVVAEGLWHPLPCHIPPGMAALFELRVESPPAPGDYNLLIDLVENGIAWFSERGIAPLRLPISVAATPGPRVCIINGNCIANDAVGSHVVAQIKALRANGYLPLLLTSFVDDRLPRDLRRAMITISPALFHQPDERSKPAVEFFRRADLVIVNYSTYYDLAELIREVRGAPVIFDYHGVTPPHIWGIDQPGYQDLVRGVANLNLVRFADYAVGHSRFTADELIATGCIAANRVSVHPYAVVRQVAYAGPPDPALVERHGLAGKRVLLYVGRMARNKRIHDLVEALPAIHARHPETVLLLVGDHAFPAYAEYVAQIRARAQELDIAEAVIFTGQVPDVEVYYDLCDLFVTASIHEGFCMPVIEAMARGKPVVAANATALPGTIAGAGLLFPPEDFADLARLVITLFDELPPPDDRSDPLKLLRVAPATDAELAALREQTIAIVTPRYGMEVLGGAETGMRSWAEQLASLGYRVEALSTCTIHMTEWIDHRQPGVSRLNGVTVHHFSTDMVDAGQFHSVLQKVNRGERPTRIDEERLMRNNLQSSALSRHLCEHADDYACVIFSPYLFGTSYWAAQAVPDKAIMVPCLHDEPSARLGIFREMLESATAIFFNTDAESDFASHVLGLSNPYRVRIGYGFSDQPIKGNENRFRSRYGIDGPVLLYSGRLEHAKNVPLLIDYFVRYKEEHPGSLVLALAGSGDIALPPRQDIRILGMLSDQQLLADAYAAGLALCQPSLNESFSIVIMESWLQGRPVLVHAGCAVTRDHIEKSGGGYAFDSYETFREALDTLLADPAHAATLGAHGRDYVGANYAWNVLSERMLRSIAAYSRSRSLYSRLAQRGIRRALDFTHTRYQDALLELTAQALREHPNPFANLSGAGLYQAAQVARPDYQVRSGLPLLGRLVAWTRRQLTAHLKEPYLDPVIADQERFNRTMVATLLPALEQSLREQRQLRRELEALRERLGEEHK